MLRLLLVLLLLGSGACARSLRAEFVSPEALPRAAADEQAGAVMLLKESEYLYVTEGGYAVENREHRVIEVRAESGLGQARVSIRFAADGVLLELKARTVHADGTIEEVAPGQVIRDEGHGQEKLVTFDFPGARVGDRLEYTYVVRMAFRTSAIAVMSETIPVLRYRAVFRGGPRLVAAVAAYSDGRTVHREVGGDWRLVVEQNDLPAQAREPLSGGWTFTEPWWVLHLEEQGNTAVAAQWHGSPIGDVAAWVRRLQNDGAHRSAVDLAIEPGCAEAACRIERAVELTRRATTFDGYGQVARARPPREVLRDGKANNFEKAILLWHLLEQAGIEARPAALTRRLSARFDPQFPSIHLLNHMIVHVPLQAGVSAPLWIDPSCEPCAVGQLSAGIEGTQAFVFSSSRTPTGESAMNAELLAVTGGAPPLARSLVTWDVHVDADGALDVQLANDAWANSATAFRRNTQKWGAQEWARWAEAWANAGSRPVESLG
jgi:hypothetical protein